MDVEKIDRAVRKGFVLLSEVAWGYTGIVLATNSEELMFIRVLAGLVFLGDVVAFCTSLNLIKSPLDIDKLLNEGLENWW